MSTDLGAITAAALALSDHDRATLLDRLRDSLPDDAPDPGYEQAWADEIGRRLADVRSGKEKPIPWAEVRERLARDADADAR